MHIYSAKIRLGGSVLNELSKTGLTAPEIIILQNIHGEDAVVDIKAVSEDRRAHEGERERLELAYGYNPESKKPWVAELFGGAHQDLPTQIKGVEAAPASRAPRSRKAPEPAMAGVPKSADGDAAAVMG